MATGTEMLINTLVNTLVSKFQLQGEVEKIKAVVATLDMNGIAKTLNELPQLAENMKALRNEVAELRRSIEPGSGDGYRGVDAITFGELATTSRDA